MKGHLIQIDARDGSGATTRYLASADHPSLCHLNGQQWVPAIAKLPSLRYDFFGGDFNGAITVPSASFSVAIEGVSTFTTLRFSGARVRLYTGEIGDAWGSFTLRFDGRINAEPTLAAGIANFEAGADDSWLDKPLLGLFLGTGGIEGPTDLTGTVKPLALGACRFAPGVLVDATNNVYAVSAYAVQGITAAYDRVVAHGTSTGDYASLALLIAAAIPNGGWGTCKALGLVRLGSPADGQVSFDVSGDNAGAAGYVRKPGAMIRRIAEIAGGTVNTTNLAALDTARAWNLTLALTAQTTARDAIQGIADSVCAVAGITWTGTLFVAPLGYGTSSQTLKSDGTAAPPVASVEVKPVGAPFWRLATEAEPTWVVHAASEVASQYNLRGLYSATRVYRLDDLVESADGSAWVYINATAGAGNAPPTWPTTSNSYWTTASPATAASWSLVTGATKPENSADITGTVTGAPTLTVLCDYTGVAKTGQLTLTSGYKLSKGGTDVTTSATWSTTTLTGTCTASIGAATGVFSLSAISTNCRVRIDAAYGGKTYSSTINLERQLDNAPTGGSPGGGTTASVAINGSVSSTTHAAITASDLYVKAGTNGQIVLTAGDAFYHDTTAISLHVYTIIQKWNGSAFADLGTQTQSPQPSTYVSAENLHENGVFASSYTDTSLTAGVEYRYRVTGRTFSGTVTRYFSGTFTGVGT